MNRSRLIAFAFVFGLGLPLAALAQTSRNVDGTITRIDEAGAKMTIRHGPLTELGMDGMTMVFRVKDPEMLKGDGNFCHAGLFGFRRERCEQRGRFGRSG